jgi:hypothetical protein
MKKDDWRQMYGDVLTKRKGTTLLRFHTCSNCGTTHIPQDQQSTNDGLLAMTVCDCGHQVCTVIGKHDFILEVSSILDRVYV